MKDAEKYLPLFPKLTKSLEKEIYRTHNKYLLYNHKEQTYCTACEKEFRISQGCLFHKSEIYCPECGQPVTCIDITKNYSGKKAHDVTFVIVYLAGKDGNLYARCYKQELGFKRGELHPWIWTEETHRYVFTPKGTARYGVDYHPSFKEFHERSNFNTPNFFATGYSNKINFNHAEINLSTAIKKTWLKYSAVVEYTQKTRSWMSLSYLHFYRLHQGVERLVKCGYEKDVEFIISRRDGVEQINWKETELHKMIGIDRKELQYAREKGLDIYQIKNRKNTFPEYPLEQADRFYNVFGKYATNMHVVFGWIGRDKIPKLAKYVKKQQVSFTLYRDYINFCRELNYDLTDPEILYPPHFIDAHDRADAALQAKKIKIKQEQIKAITKKCKKYQYEEGDYFIRQPHTPEEIIEEGRILRHCVGGYAKRHFEGSTTIMFLRKKEEPDIPFYTIEVDNKQKIVQCYGYRNNLETPKPDEIKLLEKHYQDYLNGLNRKQKGA